MIAPVPLTRGQKCMCVALVAGYAVSAHVAPIATAAISLFAATTASWLFLVTYVVTTRWEQRVTGRAMVMLAASISSLLTLTALGPFVPDLASRLAALVYAALAVSSIRLLGSLRRVQRERRTAADSPSITTEAGSGRQ